MSKLKLAPGLALPPEAALQRFGILAMSGAGKSNAAVVLAEEMYDAGIPWVAVDPKGDWWGIRSSADGKSDGLLVPVFGGLRGDVPLEETGGKLLAELIAERRLTCVLDISEMSKGAQLRFLTDFADTLLRKNRAPLQVIAEEADEYLPQRVMKREAPCVGAWTKLVKRGRFRGVFVTLVTQRSAALSKDALSQIDTLIPMRVGDPRDKRALKDWVVEHDVGQEMFDSLPRLDDGEAWIWSPHKLKLMERIRFRRRRTFDSGATPDWKEREPARLADVDLDVVREEMAETIERTKAEDPKELRRRIAGLQKELRSRPTEKETVEVEKTVEVPVLANGAVDRLQDAVAAIRDASESLSGAAGEIAGELRRIVDVKSRPRAAATAQPRASAPRRQRRSAPGEAVEPPRPSALADDEDLTGPQQRVLDALAWLEAVGFPRPGKIQIGFIARYRVGKRVGGTFANVLGELRSRGLIDYPSAGQAELTEVGRGLAEAPDIEQTPEGLQAAVFERLDGPESRVLRVLIEHYPDALSKRELGELAGYAVGDRVGGTYANVLGRLRSLGLIDYPSPGDAVALPILFLEGAVA